MDTSFLIAAGSPGLLEWFLLGLCCIAFFCAAAAFIYIAVIVLAIAAIAYIFGVILVIIESFSGMLGMVVVFAKIEIILLNFIHWV